MAGFKANIIVDGIPDVKRSLERLGSGAKDALDPVAAMAARRLHSRVGGGLVPVRTGTTAGTLSLVPGRGRKAASAGVRAKAPWYGWLDFGGKGRVYRAGGRWLWPEAKRQGSDFAFDAERAIQVAIRRLDLGDG